MGRDGNAFRNALVAVACLLLGTWAWYGARFSPFFHGWCVAFWANVTAGLIAVAVAAVFLVRWGRACVALLQEKGQEGRPEATVSGLLVAIGAFLAASLVRFVNLGGEGQYLAAFSGLMGAALVALSIEHVLGRKALRENDESKPGHRPGSH